MKIVDFVRPELILPELSGRKKAEVVAELAHHMARQQPEINAGSLIKVLMEREQLASTAIGEEVAIPHGKIDAVGHLVGALGRSRAGLEFDSIDGAPTHLVFMLVAPQSSTGVHLKALARLSRLFRDGDFRARLMAAPSRESMYQIISDEDAKY